MNKFKSWAVEEQEEDFDFTEVRRNEEPVQPQQQVQPTYQQPVPQAQPQGAVFYSPPPQPMMIQQSTGFVGNYHPAPQPIEPIPRTCCLVKADPDGDPYERMMAQIPDSAKEAGIDKSNGVDAMSLSAESIDDHIHRVHSTPSGMVRQQGRPSRISTKGNSSGGPVGL